MLMLMLCFVVFSLLGFVCFSEFWKLLICFECYFNYMSGSVICFFFFFVIMLFDRFSIMGFAYNGELNCKVGDLRDFLSAGYWLITLHCSLVLWYNMVGECFVVLLRDLVAGEVIATWMFINSCGVEDVWFYVLQRFGY